MGWWMAMVIMVVEVIMLMSMFMVIVFMEIITLL